MSCKTSITTSSGTFSFSEKVMTKCEAKKYCRDKDAILAPITTQEDKDAVMKMLESDCSVWKQYTDSMYHIGLDVYPCGNQQERVFTNGVVYNKDIHGPLYDDVSETEDKCPWSYMMYFSGSPLKISELRNCIPQPSRALCLKPPAAVSSPITQGNVDYIKLDFNQSVAVFGGMFCFTLGIVVFAAKAYKRSKYLERKLCDLENYN